MDEVDVEVTVAVIVDERRTGAGDLGRKILSLLARIMAEDEAARLGDLGEREGALGRGGEKQDDEFHDFSISRIRSRARAMSAR